jgi:vancomycin resistance protein YoaR
MSVIKAENLALIFFVIFLLSPSFAFAENEGFLTIPHIEEKLKNDIRLKIEELDFSLPGKEIEDWTKEESTWSYDKNYSTEIENIRLCESKKSIICKITLEDRIANHTKKISLVSLSEDSLKDYLETLAIKVNKDPEEAKFKLENGKVSVFSLGEEGVVLDEEKSFEIILSYLKSNDNPDTLELAYGKISPNVSSETIDNMGVDTLIGQGKSNFRGSPKNRIYNIKVATERFNGILIKPDEEFSFVGILGEVDGEHGYLPELVIKKDKTEPEFGGGICQVSTTAFRAALNAGLEITARRNHAYPVQYYSPQGMDATVYVPRPDLRFKNNTPGHILIQPKIEGTELTFDFYGTQDGRKVNIIGPKIIERGADGAMKTILTQEVYDKDGNIIIKDVFNSNYDSPNKYPHPGTTNDVLTEKPKDWSDKEWREYKKEHRM